MWQEGKTDKKIDFDEKQYVSQPFVVLHTEVQIDFTP